MTLANDPTHTATFRFNLTQLTWGDMVRKVREQDGSISFYDGLAYHHLDTGDRIEGDLMVSEDFSYAELQEHIKNLGGELVEIEELDEDPDPVKEEPLRTAAAFRECDPVENWTACSTCHELFMLHGIRSSLSPDDTEPFVPSHRPPQAQPETAADKDTFW